MMIPDGRKRLDGPRRGWLLAVASLSGLLLLGAGVPARADSVLIPASKDNTLFETVDGSLSNGSGQFVFAGKTRFSSVLRRALLEFDIACHVPAPASIKIAALSLTMDMTISGSVPVTLHRASAEWGEGASDAGGPEGGGTVPERGDATWIHTFHDTDFWTSAGGDYSPTPSATTMVGPNGVYTWNDFNMASDVQLWLSSPASNHGWILIGDETVDATAKRFGSREHPDPPSRPSLYVEYTTTGNPAGRVPLGNQNPGTPLRIVKAAGGNITLSWGLSCLCTDHDYEVYEGQIGSFASHQPRLCSTTGTTTATLLPSSGARYYLVVPHNGVSEGSYGLRSNGLERPQGASPCLGQEIGPCN